MFHSRVRLKFSRRYSFLLNALLILANLLWPAGFAEVTSGSKDNSLQFTVGNHALRFFTDRVYIASGDHMFGVAFANSEGASPVPEDEGLQSSKAQSFEKISYSNLWPGIDLNYRQVDGGIVESTWIVDSGADPDAIQLIYNAPVSIKQDGSLKISYSNGWMRESAPVAWQERDGHRVPINVEFKKAKNAGKKNIVGFELGKYDASLPLMIDPILQWNTFLGSSATDEAKAIVVDGSGNAFVTGRSGASWGSPVAAYTGGKDVFVAKISSTGTLLWHTFLGASSDDFGRAISLDGSGNIYVSGNSVSSWGSPVNAWSGGSEVFVAKLDSSGGLLWNTFMGSAMPTVSDDFAGGVAVDSSGNAYVAGISNSTWGSPLNTNSGGKDAFVAKLNSSGVRQWNTFLGSANDDEGQAISVDSAGNVYIVGSSKATWGSPVNAFGGTQDAFVAKLNSSGVYQWHTFMGSSTYDLGYAITVDTSNNIYVAGYSYATWGAPVTTFAGGVDAFAAKLNNSGVRQWNTFMGSSGTDLTGVGSPIVLDSVGNVYVAGYSSATWGTPIDSYQGSWDAFAAKFNNSGALQWNTFLGSSEIDYGESIAVTGSGNAYIAGSSYATWGSPKVAYAGGEDAFVARYSVVAPTYIVTATTDGHGTPDSWTKMVTHGATASFQLTPQTGYTTDSTVGGTCPAGSWSGDTYTTGAIVSACTVNFTHTINSYSVTASVDAHGGLDKSSDTVNHGSTASFTVTPDTGYSTDSTVGGTCPSGSWSGQTYTTGNIVGACNVSFTHSLKSYTVSTSATAVEGSIAPPSQVVSHGSSASFNVTANTGFTIHSVTGCGGTWTGNNPFITGAITSTCTVVATFTQNSYTVSTSAPAGQGTITPPSGTITHGNTLEFTVTAEPGYTINTVTGCGGTWTGTNPYTTGPVTADCTVTATFDRDGSEDECTFFIIPLKNGKTVAVCL